jgi:type I restriction enzyme S subunit
VKWESIENLVEKTAQCEPGNLGRQVFSYLDISSVDKETKQIAAAQFIPVDKAPSRARKLVKANDVLVSTVRPNLNAVALVPKKFDGEIASTGFCVLRAQPSFLNPLYLFYFTQTAAFITHLVKAATGANYPAVSDNDVLDALIRLPDAFVDQRRIAGILQQADRLRRIRSYALNLGETVLSSTFLNLFGDPIHNPKGFPRERLEDLILPTRPITYGILKPGPDTPKGVPYVRVLDIQDGTVLTHNIRKTTAEIDQLYKRSRLKAGDLLLSIRGQVGRLGIVPRLLDLKQA